MRQFDTYQSYLDNVGDVLVGRVRFCNLDGSMASIYDVNGNPLGNPILTDNSGRISSQVFLDDHDYLVFFEKYVGHASMTEETEPDDWEETGSAVNRYNTVGVKVDVEAGFQSVDTIDKLKKLDPRASAPIVGLLGYYSAGDKPLVFYRWDDGCTAASDDGSVVSTDVDGVDEGKWVVIPSFDYLDVRHFGAFPKSTSTEDSIQRLAIQSASAYANKIGVRLYFYSDKTRFNYDVSGLTLNNVDCSGNVMLFIAGNDDAILTNVKNAFCKGNVNEAGEGRMIVRGKELRTSFNANSSVSVVLEPEQKIIFDTEYLIENGCEFTGVEVSLEVDHGTRYSRFERCFFTGAGKFKKETLLTFRYCEIRQSMFEDFDSGFLNLEGCYTNINEWSDMGKYIDFMVDTRNYDIDLYGRTIDNDLDYSTIDLSLRNATVNGEVKCVNFKCVGCYIERLIAKTYNIVDSDVGVGGDVGNYSFSEIPGDGTFGFYAYNSTLRLYDDLWISSFTSIVRCITPDYSNARTIRIYPRVDTYQPTGLYTMRDITIKDSSIACNLKFTVAGVGVTPYVEEGGYIVYKGYEDIKVTGVVCKDNYIYNNNAGTTSRPPLEPIVIDKDFRQHFNETQGSYEFRRNYEYKTKQAMLDNDLDRSEYSWEGTCDSMPVRATEGGTSVITHTDQTSLKKFIYCFGENKNLCNYGFDKITVNFLKISWNRTSAAGYYQMPDNGNEILVVESDGFSHLDNEMAPEGNLLPTSGILPLSYVNGLEVRFTPKSTRMITYNNVQ